MPIPVVADEHPDADRLRAFGLGRLGDEELQALERHIEHCGQCCEVLRHVADDSLVETLRDADRAAVADTVALSGDASAHGVVAIPPELENHPRYSVKARLGMGGMGVVYRAEHRLMQRDVAIKVIHPRLIDRPQAVARFHHEVQAAARLSHEHVVRAYDAEQVDTVHFLVMEYVEGESLDRLIARKGRLPIATACRYARQAALGLEAAHAQGMAHRDIKPQNIMIDATGRVKVLDFGLARFVLDQEAEEAPRLTTAHLVLGTPDYMAPEQARESRAADIRSDIYSLGCTLYHMLAGQPPFPAGSVIEKLALHISGRPQAIEELRPGVPEGVADVINRMMARDPAARYPSPAHVAEALEPFTRPLPSHERVDAPADSLPVITPVKASLARSKSRSTPPSLVTAALAVVLVPAVIAAVIVAVGWQREGGLSSRPPSSVMPAVGGGTPSGAPPRRPPQSGEASGFQDDFSESQLSKHWTILEPESGRVAIEDGSLVMVPNADTGWYNDGHGMLISQEVKGDFVATARLSVRGVRNPLGPPTEQFNSAGLLARDPGSGPTSEKWIMISLGQQASSLGTKTEPTWESQSWPEFQRTSATGGALRLARMGNRFSLLKRLDGEQKWTLLTEHQLPNTPEVLQVGPAVNAYQAADIRAAFESVRITVPVSAGDLYRD